MMAQRAETQVIVSIPRKFNPKWLVVGLILACMIGGGSVGGYYLYNQVITAVNQPKPPVQPGFGPPTTLSEKPTPTTTSPAPSTVTSVPVENNKVLAAGGMGLLIDKLDDGKFVSYCLAVWIIPPGVPYQYEFPLVLVRGIEGVDKIIANIDDPGIEQAGGEWSSGLIADPDYPNFVFQVKFVRVEGETYKYKTEFLCSPDGGTKWYPPMLYPPK